MIFPQLRPSWPGGLPSVQLRLGRKQTACFFGRKVVAYIGGLFGGSIRKSESYHPVGSFFLDFPGEGTV